MPTGERDLTTWGLLVLVLAGALLLK